MHQIVSGCHCSFGVDVVPGFLCQRMHFHWHFGVTIYESIYAETILVKLVPIMIILFLFNLPQKPISCDIRERERPVETTLQFGFIPHIRCHVIFQGKYHLLTSKKKTSAKTATHKWITRGRSEAIGRRSTKRVRKTTPANLKLYK